MPCARVSELGLTSWIPWASNAMHLVANDTGVSLRAPTNLTTNSLGTAQAKDNTAKDATSAAAATMLDLGRG